MEALGGIHKVFYKYMWQVTIAYVCIADARILADFRRHYACGNSVQA